jgi:tRNA(Arg) A34 adenosine deaminase TadA
MMNQEYFMQLALAAARKGDAPYGAVLVQNGLVVATAYNTVQEEKDPSAHAEINVIRRYTKNINNTCPDNLIIYTTGEPCPMCATACIWAGVSEIIYAVSIQDLIAKKQLQINISCEEIISKSFRNIKVTKGVLRKECLELFV